MIVEPSFIQGLAADCPLLRCLGFNLAPSVCFFPLSPPSHIDLFHSYVVAQTALGVSSN